MTFVTPDALWWAALALPVVGSYILRVRARQVTVPTLLFWDRAFKRRQERLPWRRLRHVGSLLIQLLILALLVAALADPAPAGGTAGRVVLVIDTSASMSARDGGGIRLDQAKHAAMRAVDSLGRRYEIAVVTAGGPSAVVVGFTRHPPSVHRAIKAIAHTDGPTRVTEAVETARRMLGDNGRVVVFTDRCFRGSDQLAAAPDVTLVGVGNSVGNVGITRFQPRRDLVGPEGYSVLVEASNWSDEEVACRFDLELDGKTVYSVREVRLPPNRRWSNVYTGSEPGGGVLTGKLSPADALPADNEAQAVLPARKRRQVVLVADRKDPTELFVEHALLANPMVNLVGPVPEAPAAIEPGTLLVFYRRPPERLPTGGPGQPPVGSLVIDPERGCEGLWRLGEPLLGPVLVGDWDRGSRLLSHVRLDTAIFPTARQVVSIDEGVLRPVVLSRIERSVLYGAHENDRHRVLVLAVGPATGDLALRAAFPILIANALEWLANDDPGVIDSATAGFPAMAALAAPPNGEVLWLWPPDGEPRRVSTVGARRGPAGAWQVPVGELERAGVWRLGRRAPDGAGLAGTPLAVIPCNVASESEGDLRAPPVTTDTEAPFFEARQGLPVWVGLLVAVLALLALEWLGYQRRWVA